MVICILLLAASIGWRVMTDYSRVLRANWGFSLPFKALCFEVYEKDSGSSFHGDDIRYHVFSYKYEDSIDLMFAWIGREQETIFRSSYSEAAEQWLDDISVPEEYRPDYDNCWYWYHSQEDNSEIIVFWDEDVNCLYIVESFL